MKATAWTVSTGTKPEPMDVEILGVLRGARGPGHDLILAQLHGTKPEYPGVVEGMSGSPVYIGTKLLGALSFRIGQFAKDPIAGITPIEQMIEVRDLPIGNSLREADNSQPDDSVTALATSIRQLSLGDYAAYVRYAISHDGNTAGDERIPPGGCEVLAAEDGRHGA